MAENKIQYLFLPEWYGKVYLFCSKGSEDIVHLL